MADASLYTNAAIDGTPRYIKDSSTNSKLSISTGNVGIGTDSAACLLTIKSNLDTSYGGIGIVDKDTSHYTHVIWQNSDSGVLDMRDQGTKKIELKANGYSYFNGGNVGIGTDNPAEKLDANGNLKLSGGHRTISVDDGSSSSGKSLTINAGDGVGTNMDGGNIMLLPGSNSGPNPETSIPGRVGIGTNTLYGFCTIYDVNNSVSCWPTLMIMSANSYGTGLDLDATGTGGRNFRIQSCADGASQGAGKFDIRDADAGVSRLTIDSSGNTGIGTTSPQSALHIDDDAGGTDKGYITLEELGANGVPASNGQMTVYAKGSKIVMAMKVSGTVRYTSIDMSANGNSWTQSTTTAP